MNSPKTISTTASSPTTDPVTVEAGDTGADVTTSPTRTQYQLLAAKVLKDLEAVAAQIPRLESRHEATEAFVRRYRGVRLRFLATSVINIEQNETLRALNKLDVDAGHDALQFIEAFRPVLDRIEAFAGNVRYTLGARKAHLAAAALQVYDMAKGFSRDPASAPLISIVQNLKRDLGPRGGRRTPEISPDESPDVPAARGSRS
jgi:hypothetical protein